MWLNQVGILLKQEQKLLGHKVEESGGAMTVMSEWKLEVSQTQSNEKIEPRR